MTEKRPWFRFHLLTLVLMVLAAGGVLWLNVCKRSSEDIFAGRHMVFMESCQPFAYGWPLDVAIQSHGFYTSSGVIVYGAEKPFIKWRWIGIAMNVVVLFLLVGSCGASSEFLLRRRPFSQS
jgi:hypothetical protein